MISLFTQTLTFKVNKVLVGICSHVRRRL